MKKYTVADFGCGIGAMAKAFIDEEFDVVFAAGRDVRQFGLYEKYTGHRVDTLLEPGVYNCLDMYEDLLTKADVMAGRIFYPCNKVFMHRSEKTGKSKDWGQWGHAYQYIKQYKPKAFLLESGCRIPNDILEEQFSKLREEYNITSDMLAYSEYTGIPLRQKRFYVVGIRRELGCPMFQFPEKVKFSVEWKDILQLDKKAEEVYYNSRYQLLADSLEIGKLYKASQEQWSECYTYPIGLYDRIVLRDSFGVRELTNNEAALLRGMTGFDFNEAIPRRQVFRWINTAENEYMIRRLARRLRLCLRQEEERDHDWDEWMIWNKLLWMQNTSGSRPRMAEEEERRESATGRGVPSETMEEIMTEETMERTTEEVMAEETMERTTEEVMAEKTMERTTEETIIEETTEAAMAEAALEEAAEEIMEEVPPPENNGCSMKGADSRDDCFFSEAVKHISVFLSYCQRDDKLADSIDDYFKKRGLELKRDKREIPAWKSIRQFMESIRDHDFVVMVITDNYLKSHNCMFEVLQVMQERRYRERIFPLVMEGGIYEPEKRIDYIKYWEEKSRRLEEKLCGIALENSVEGAEDLRKYKQITTTIAQFMRILSDMNNPPQPDYNLAVETELRRYIQSRSLPKG